MIEVSKLHSEGQLCSPSPPPHSMYLWVQGVIEGHSGIRIIGGHGGNRKGGSILSDEHLKLLRRGGAGSSPRGSGPPDVMPLNTLCLYRLLYAPINAYYTPINRDDISTFISGAKFFRGGKHSSGGKFF